MRSLINFYVRNKNSNENTSDPLIVDKAKLYTIEGNEKNFENIISEIFVDNVDESSHTSSHKLDNAIESVAVITFRPGVTDNPARSAVDAIHTLFPEETYKVASGLILFLGKPPKGINIKDHVESFYANPLIQSIKILSVVEFANGNWKIDKLPSVISKERDIELIDLDVDVNEIYQLSVERCWALSKEEIQQIKNYYLDPMIIERRLSQGLPRQATDVELEIIAQTWSEHCKHKIFAANIEYEETEHDYNKITKKTVNGVFKKYIKGVTEKIIEDNNIDWAISLFKDNAGIVRFDKNIDLCVKVETHNSPSALDPYGGALTGILGVNRDIIGTGMGALPVANTNVLCFGYPNYSNEQINKLPSPLKNPKIILKGVHKGIEDGGNKSGIPTINGAIHFHDNFSGKPVVYCGTVGVLPQNINGNQTSEKEHRPGDHIIVVGGEVGIDGIHGATFSSMELTENAPATAVQIGDPFTQKKVMDFIIKARDRRLFSGITDNGAGGVSSSIGEMATFTGGATIDLKKMPTKYPGLAPYELMISESQERMSLAVPKESLSNFLQLAKEYGVTAVDIGQFTNTNTFTVFYGDKKVADLDLNFLHESLKPMNLKARWTGPSKQKSWIQSSIANSEATLEESIHNVLSEHNVCSKEQLVRQYDHEVKGQTIIKPFNKKEKSGPNNSGVIWTKNYGSEEYRGVAIGSGIAFQYSEIDPYYMAQMAIDEAIRNVVSTGGDPDKIALCDNFCWPDPITSESNPDGEYKLAQLVRSCEGLYEAAYVYKAPFVSGKDSMKNDFHGKGKDGEKIKISIPPTLLITAISDVSDVRKTCTSSFKNPGDHIFLIGNRHYEQLNYSTYSRIFDPENITISPMNLNQNYRINKKVHELIQNQLLSSCHDISDGGLVTAIIESMFAHNCGVHLNLNSDDFRNFELRPILFNESPCQYVVSISEKDLKVFEEKMQDLPYSFLGHVTEDLDLHILKDNFESRLSIKDLYRSWSQL